MALTMKQIVEDARSFVQQKQAEFKEKEAMVGDDPSSYPGSQHDKKVDESAKAPHPEVKQDLPPGGTTAAGAEKAEKLEAGHSKDSTEPAKATVDKEPAVSDNAMAEPKTGSAKMANDLLASVRALQGQLAPEGGVKKASDDEEAEAGAEADKKDSTEENKEEAGEEAATEENKEAGSSQLELTQDVLAKIASIILSTEEGWEFTEQTLTKEAGAEAARETIATLQKQAEEIEKAAAYEQGAADAEALIGEMIQTKQAEDVQAIYALGAADAEADLCKLAQAIADESVADLAGGEGMEGAEDVVDEMGSAPEDDDISEEELMQALQELAQEGQIDQEDIQAIMDYITQADSAVAEDEGAGAPEEEGMDVAASANLQQSILDAIKRVKAGQAA